MIRLFTLLAAVVSLVLPAGAQSPPQAGGDYRSGGYDAQIEQFRGYVDRHLPLDEAPALAIGFYKDGFIWADGFGLADVENEVPASAKSAFRLASVTKPMTAIAVLKLVEQGKVDLDAEVQEYVPYFPEKEFAVTVGPLLGHIGGISHYKNYDEEGHFKYHKDTREAIAVFADFALVAKPGTRYQYSSYGYNLLGAVIEGAAGAPYGRYVKEVLWDPYGMDDTRMDDPYELIPNRVTGYRRGPGGTIIRSEFVDISSRFAAGGTRSTVIDLLKLVRGLDQKPALSPETMETMFTSMQTSEGRYTGYGMGWGIRPTNGRFRVMHTGGQAETRTYLAYFPSLHFGIAAAVNFEGNDHGHYVDRLYQLLLDEPMELDVYVGDRYGEMLYDAMDIVFDFGFGYYDRYGRASTADGQRIEEAFARFNRAVRRQRFEEDREQAWETVERGRHPAGDEYLVSIGSHMADVLGDANGADYLNAVHGLGPIAFFADYISHYKADRSYARRFRFTQEFERTVMAWKGDWDRTWNDFTRRLAVTRTTDLPRLTQRLKTEFAGANVYPDYSADLTGLVISGIRRRNLAAATAAATMAVDLYPTSARPYVLAGLCHLVMDDEDRARSSIARAHAIDPSGAADSGVLNGHAYRLKSFGYTEPGLALLEIALELHPNVANLYDSAGEFYLELGDKERAIAYYEKALEIDPGFEHARTMLEKIHED
jgi:CubicO group peptidase (beta-lactamase class C family)/Flp pilus assembly protein TadD